MIRWFGVSLAIHLLIFGLLALHETNSIRMKPVMIDLSLMPDTVPARKSAAPGTWVAAGAPERTKTVNKEMLPVPLPQQQVPNHLPQHPLVPAVAASVTPRDPIPVAQQAPATSGGASKAVPSVPMQSSGAGTGTLSSGGAHTGSPSASSDGMQPQEKARNRYLREHFSYIRDLIMKQLVYPALARRMNWSGKVTVCFLVNENGEVSNIRVVESSGYPVLDKNATETVKKAAPFPKPPVPAELVVPVSFKLL